MRVFAYATSSNLVDPLKFGGSAVKLRSAAVIRDPKQRTLTLFAPGFQA